MKHIGKVILSIIAVVILMYSVFYLAALFIFSTSFEEEACLKRMTKDEILEYLEVEFSNINFGSFSEGVDTRCGFQNEGDIIVFFGDNVSEKIDDRLALDKKVNFPENLLDELSKRGIVEFKTYRIHKQSDIKNEVKYRSGFVLKHDKGYVLVLSY